MSADDDTEGQYECTMCDLPITWDGGYAMWVHWDNGAIYCPSKTASVISIPDALNKEGTQP